MNTELSLSNACLSNVPQASNWFNEENLEIYKDTTDEKIIKSAEEENNESDEEGLEERKC